MQKNIFDQRNGALYLLQEFTFSLQLQAFQTLIYN